MSALSERITSLLRDTLAVEIPSPNTDLIDEGLLDSLAMVSLIVQIEAQFGIELPLDDFNPDHFRTVERMTAFVAKAAGAA